MMIPVKRGDIFTMEDVPLESWFQLYTRQYISDFTKRYNVSIVAVDSSKAIVPHFYRYMPLSHFLDLQKNGLRFSCPSLWNDSDESTFINTDLSDFGGFQNPYVWALCTKNSEDSSEVSWYMYRHKDEPVICIEFDANRLLNTVNEFARHNGMRVYLSQIQYLNIPNSSIYSKLRAIKHNMPDLFENFNETCYVRLLSIKNLAYKFEEEWRIFLVADKNTNNSKVINIPWNNETLPIWGIMVEPMKPIDSSSPLCEYHKSQHADMVDNVFDIIKSNIPTLPIETPGFFKVANFYNKDSAVPKVTKALIDAIE